MAINGEHSTETASVEPAEAIGPPAPQRRNIRLKEWRPGLDTILRPAADYLAASDGTLPDAEYRVRTDADGFILPPRCEEANEVPKLLLLGDSFVESIYVPEDRRFAAAVEAALRNGDHAIRCLNGGYSGATTLHLLLALLAKVGRSPRTSVLLVVPSNDALALGKRGGYWCAGDTRYSLIVPVPPGATAQNDTFDLSDLVTVLNLFVDACRRLRLPLTLATFPHRTAPFDADPWLQRRFASAAAYARIHKRRSQVNERARAVARRLGVPLLDLDALLSTRTELFYDDLHVNVAGSTCVAQILVDEWIAQRTVADCKAASS
jgi:lysophospholipase L1-like esterase